ncbi:hypothetical protein PVAND_017043 [Polypedilum vanderplanki]|uniref:Uncharacterized protein n=1 Tax=Polypedilum vanderplanki TaxID=319348 RepID=A0A9J6BH28_POLVA|nr:hypothetical protein PVAND_017043 [Polypedilum vanderplanki]
MAINTQSHNSTFGNVFAKQFKFLTYVEEIETFDKVENLPSSPTFFYLLPDRRMFEIFITMDTISIDLVTRVLFSENFCGVYHLRLVNTFDLQSQKWENELENFNHFDDFCGCLMAFFVEFEIDWYFDNFGKIDSEF